MLNSSLILLGKTVSKVSQLLKHGNGSTWPGHIALQTNPHFISQLLKESHIKTILIAGTNGKTTTSTLIRTALEENGKKVMQNESGANLLNGIASTLILNTNNQGKLPYDYAIFEVDENALPLILKEIQPDYLLLLNLFRDQLDRYGEVNSIAKNWNAAFEKLSDKTTLILSADDPQIAYLGKKRKALYFGLGSAQFSTDKTQQAADSVYCPKCGEKLVFHAIAFSHLGDWECKKCGLKRPKVENKKFTIYPLSGLYNKYNILAANLVLKEVGLTEEEIEESLTHFKPAFGRQEIITYKKKQVQLFLSKNPTSFNQSYTTIKDLGASTLVLVLNDRIPDGRDVSWIWDVDLPELEKFKNIIITGDRVYDMALRVKYEDYKNFQTFENLDKAITTAIEILPPNETLYILPTYSAMLEVRKILTGRKIL